MLEMFPMPVPGIKTKHTAVGCTNPKIVVHVFQNINHRDHWPYCGNCREIVFPGIVTTQSPTGSYKNIPASIFIYCQDIVTANCVRSILQMIVRFHMAGPEVEYLQPFGISTNPQTLAIQQQRTYVVLLIHASAYRISGQLMSGDIEETQPITSTHPDIPGSIFAKRTYYFSGSHTSIPINRRIIIESFSRFSQIIHSSQIQHPDSTFCIAHHCIDRLVAQASGIWRIIDSWEVFIM